jgi:hypothetical protein
MFGNKNLLTEGVQSSAIVLNSKGYDLRGDGGGYGHVHLDLEVHYTDGTTATISRKEKTADVGLPFAGQIVPVRYDDSDHSKVEIDTPAMKAQRTAAHEAVQASSIARARAELGNPAAQGASATALRNLQDGDPLPTFDQIKRAGRDQ